MTGSINNKLYLDRDKNIGNTDGDDGKGRAHVKVSNDPNEPLPSTEAGFLANLNGFGSNPGSGALVTILDIALENDANYKNIEWSVSCFRDAVFTVLHIDDLGGADTETILASVRVGSNQYNDSDKKVSPFTAGGTGTQVLRVRAQNISSTSQLDACLGVQKFV